MQNNEMLTDRKKTLNNLERDFILIMKPDELIDYEQNSTTKPDTRTARNLIDQLLGELEQRDLIEHETLRDIRFILDEYFHSNSAETALDYFESAFTNENANNNVDNMDDYWDTPYDSDNQINFNY